MKKKIKDETKMKFELKLKLRQELLFRIKKIYNRNVGLQVNFTTQI